MTDRDSRTRCQRCQAPPSATKVFPNFARMVWSCRGRIAGQNGVVITVQHVSGDEWEVVVKSSATTRHRVTVSRGDRERFGQGAALEDLLRASFEFLLEREPNTSILRAFELNVISRYFPEYEAEIRKRLKSGPNA